MPQSYGTDGTIQDSVSFTGTLGALYYLLNRTISDVQNTEQVLHDREARTKKILILAAVIATSQAAIYFYPGYEAMTESPTLDSIVPPSAARDVVTWYAVPTGVTSNWLLGYACVVSQLKNVLLRNLILPEEAFLTRQTLSPREQRWNTFLEISALFLAFTSTWAFAALALDDVIVSWAPFIVRLLYAAFTSLVCLTFVHWQGLAEWVEIINNHSASKGYDANLLQLRASLVDALEGSKQALLHQSVEDGNADFQEITNQFTADGVSEDERLLNYVLAVLNHNPKIGKYDASIAPMLALPYGRLQNELASHRVVREAIAQKFDLNERGRLERIQDWWRVTTLKSKLGSAAFSGWFAVSNTAITGSLYGYAETARIKISSMLPKAIAIPGGWGVFVLELIPLIGLCVKSGPQFAVGTWEKLSALFRCDDPAERKKILTQVVLPLAAMLATVSAVVASAGSGGTNARVNEQALDPLNQEGVMKWVAFLLWFAAWVSSPAVNGYYGSGVTADWALAYGRKTLSAQETEFAKRHDQIDQLIDLMKRMSPLCLKAFIDKLHAHEQAVLAAEAAEDGSAAMPAPATQYGVLHKAGSLFGMKLKDVNDAIAAKPRDTQSATQATPLLGFFGRNADSGSDSDSYGDELPLYAPTRL